MPISENVETALAAAESAAASASTAAQAADRAIDARSTAVAEATLEAEQHRTAAEAAAATATAPTDTMVATLVPNRATETGAAVEQLAGDRATRTTFYDDFTTRPNGTIAVGGTYVAASGHTVNVLGQLPAEFSGGRFTHTQTNPASTQSTYLSVDLGDAGDAGYLWAEYDVPAGADPLQTLTLVASDGMFGPPNFAPASAHLSFTPDAFRYDLIAPTNPGVAATVLGRGQYVAQEPGTYRVEVALDGTRATVTDPRGRRWLVDPSAEVIARNGTWVTLQLYNLSGATRKPIRVVRWGAEAQARALRGPHVAPVDLARVAAQPGRLLGAMQTSGANAATAITTSLSARLFGLTVPIPPSRKVLIEGLAWFDQSALVTPAVSQLAIGVYPGGNSSYGKLTTIYSGRTPAVNNGGAENYANGAPFPYALILTLDPAFTIGDAIEFQLKAQATAAGHFTFIDSGDASGSFSTLRRSTMKITELAA